MSDQQLLKRIACDPKVMVGKPVIKGARLTVELFLNLLAHGSSVEEIINEYEGLSPEDVPGELQSYEGEEILCHRDHRVHREPHVFSTRCPLCY